jgi:hypothetical protein
MRRRTPLAENCCFDFRVLAQAHSPTENPGARPGFHTIVAKALFFYSQYLHDG